MLPRWIAADSRDSSGAQGHATFAIFNEGHQECIAACIGGKPKRGE